MTELQENQERKQVPLRISKSLYDELVIWADEDFRSVNSQIEALLSKCVKQRKNNGDKILTQ